MHAHALPYQTVMYTYGKRGAHDQTDEHQLKGSAEAREVMTYQSLCRILLTKIEEHASIRNGVYNTNEQLLSLVIKMARNISRVKISVAFDNW